MPLDLALDLAHALDPVAFVQDRLNFDPDPWRGYSAPKLIIKDEAAYVSDAMQAALDPMLAVSKGRLIEMSSPNGKRGHFYENWQHGVDLERIRIIGRECPRIGPEFLEKM